MRHAPCVLLAASALLAGCGHTDVHEALLRPADGAGTGHAAELYMGDAPPARPFYEVALLQAVGHGSEANLTDVTRALAERGGQRGCDAVVRVVVDQGYNLAHGYGVCVRYLTAGAAPSVPASPPPARDTVPLLPAPAPETSPAPAPPSAPDSSAL